MSTHRIRIFSSLLIAFVIVKLYTNFTDVKNIALNLKLPKFNFTQIRSGDPTPTNILYPANYVQFNKPTPLRPTGFAGQAPTRIPTNTLKKPTPTTKKIIPTRYVLRPTPSPKPTKKPKPTITKYVKPTKVPPLPPITSDLRPGSTMMEIFSEVSKRMCFPPALLMAFYIEESEVFFRKTNPPTTIKIYNTYGWWKTGAGDPCFGLGYHTQTGIVPQDSVRAGVQCRNAVGNPNDIGIMGVFQISQEEETVSRKNTIATLPKNIDRRVLFDNALIFASITKNRAGQVPKDCNNWPDDVIKMVADKHHGGCLITENASGGNYCNDVLRLYKQYR